jgi:CheY-like chemotaxis protein
MTSTQTAAAAAVHEPTGWILVVDDDATDRMILFRLLERGGHHATVANDGQAALDLLRTDPFDLVLLDLLMPDPDGYAVLEQIKTDPRLAHIPVLVISGVEGTHDIVRCLQLGAEDYISKPIDPHVLRARISASLEKKRLRERQDEYLDVICSVAEAAAAAGSAGFEPARLDAPAQRPDALGRLARAVRDLGARLAQSEAPPTGGR